MADSKGGQGLKSSAAAASQAAKEQSNVQAYKQYQAASMSTRERESNKPKGTAYHIEFGETLSIRDRPVQTSVQYQREVGGGSSRPVEAQRSEESQQQSEEARFSYDEEGQRSSGPLVERYGPNKPEAPVYPSSILSSEPEKKNIVQRSRESSPLYNILGGGPEPFESGVKDFGLSIGALGVGIGVTAEETAKTGDISKSFEKGTKAAQEFFQTKRDPLKPGTEIKRGVGEVAAGVMVFGVVEPGVSGAKGASTGILRSIKILKLEKQVGLVGKTEKVGQGTYITGGGVEPKPEALYITRFGQREPGFKGPTTELYKPSPERPNLSPDEIQFHGDVAEPTAQRLGAEKLGPYTYRSRPTTATARRTFAQGVLSKEVIPVAETRKAELNLVLKGGEPLRESATKRYGVFAETRAEKFNAQRSGQLPDIADTSKPIKPFGPSTPSKGGAGTIGKASSFTKQQERLIKQYATKSSPKQSTQTKYQPPALAFGSSQLTEEQEVIRYPKEKRTSIISQPKTKSPAIFQPSQILNPPITRNPPTSELIPPINKPVIVTEDLNLRITPGIKLGPPIQIPKQPQQQTPKFDIGTPTKQITKLIQPPPSQPPIKEIIEIPPLRPPPGLLWGPLSSGSSGGSAQLLGETKGFYGNVPQESIIGVYGKKPEITYREGYGLSLNSGSKKSKKEKTPSLQIFGSSKPERKSKQKKGKKQSGFSIFRKSKGFKI